MEAARLPMICFDQKNSSDKTDFTTVLLGLISTHFDEDSSGYAKECKELDKLRSTVIHVPVDYTACGILKRYYCQLCFLLNRFPFLVGTSVPGLKFTWEDVYLGNSITHSEIEFEKAAVLYNIGAMHSFLGMSDNRSTAEGMKVSCTHLQCAAWAFQQVRDNFNSSYAPDWSYEILSFQEQTMLAQSQECILEKSMADNRKSSITAKVASQCSEFYKKALEYLEGSSAAKQFGSSQVKDWKRYLELKINFTQCVTYYYATLQAEEQQSYGERLAYAQASASKLAECVKLSQGMGDDVKTAIQFINDVVTGKYTAAKKENDFVYHEKLPSLDSLPEIKGAVLVKGIGFDVSDKAVSGPDIFSKLVPMEAHEASSLYSEEKAQLLRQVGGRLEEHDTKLVQYLASLQLDVDKLLPQFDTIPDELVEKCAAISVRPDTMKDLTRAMNELAAISTSTLAEIDEAERILQEESEQEEEFQGKYGKRRVIVMFDEINTELDKCKQAFTKASQSNAELHKAMDLHIQNLNLLASPLEEIKAALPNPQSVLEEDETSVVARIKQLSSKIDEMRSHRTALYEQLRQQVMADDITKNIVTRSSEDTKELFTAQLKKHDSLVEQIDVYLNAQPKILEALDKANVDFVPIKQKIDLALQQRAVRVESLVYSYDVYEDLLDKQQKGMEFYQKLKHNVSRVLEKTSGLHSAQKKEREMVAEKMKPKGPPPARPTANKPGAAPQSKPEASNSKPKSTGGPPKLKDYLPFMKAGGNAATAIDSFADGASLEDDLDDLDDLDDVELPDVSSAPKLKDFLPFMNKGGRAGAGSITPASMPASAGDDGDLSSLAPQLLKYLPQGIRAATPSPYHQATPGLPGSSASSPAARPQMPTPRRPYSSGNPTVGNMPTRLSLQRPANHMMSSQYQPPAAAHQPQNLSLSSQIGQPFPPASISQPGHNQFSQSQQPRQQFGQQTQQMGQKPQQMGQQPQQMGQHPHQMGQQTQQMGQHPQQMGQQTQQMGQHPQQMGQQPQQIGQQPQQMGQHPQQLGQQPQQMGQQPLRVGQQPQQVGQQSQQMGQQPQQLGQQPQQWGQQPRQMGQQSQQMGQQSQQMGQQPQQMGQQPQQMGQQPQQLGQQPQQLGQQPQQMGQQPQQLGQQPQQLGQQPQQLGQQPQQLGQQPQQMGQQPQQMGQNDQQPQQLRQQSEQAVYFGQLHSLERGQHLSQIGYPAQQSRQMPPQHVTSTIPTTHVVPGATTSHAGHSNPTNQTVSPFSTVKPFASSTLSSGPPTPLSSMHSPQLSSAEHMSPMSHTTQSQLFRPSFSNQSAQFGSTPNSLPNNQMSPSLYSSVRQSLAMSSITSTSSSMTSSHQMLQQPQSNVPTSHVSSTIQTSLASQQVSNMGVPRHVQPQQYPNRLPIPQSSHMSSSSQSIPTSIVSGGAYPSQPQQWPAGAPRMPAPGRSQDLLSSGIQEGTQSALLQPLSSNTQPLPQNASQQSQATLQQPQVTSQKPQVAPQQPQAAPQPPQVAPQPPQVAPQSLQAGPQPAQATLQHPQATLQHPQATPQHPQATPQHPQATPQHPQATPRPLQSHQSSTGPQKPFAQHPNQLPQAPSPQQFTPNPLSVQQPLPSNQAPSSQANTQQPVAHHPQQQQPQQQQPHQQSQPIHGANLATSAPGQNVRSWVQDQPGKHTPVSQNIPVLAVSPQPQSHVSDLEGASISSTRLDSSFESNIDWSKATITPDPAKKPPVTSPTKTGFSGESHKRDVTNQPILSRQNSRDTRDPYSDESALEQFVTAVERYVKQLDTLTKPSLKGPTPLDKEWQDMCEEQERESKRNSTAAGLSEPTRNRYPDIIPYDKYRVTLSGHKNDYINASLIENLPVGCPRFIAAQGPLSQTEADFWNMIIQQKVEAIIMLSRWTEQDHSDSARYWPRDRSDRLQFGNLLITMQLSNNHKFWVERRMAITDLVTKETHTCTQLHFTCWPSDKLPEPMPLLMLIKEVAALHKKQRSSKTPIIVHCGNGVSQTGVFCTLYDGVQAVNSGQGITSVAHTVNLLRQRRRGMVSSKDEYLFCHTTLLYYAQDILVKRGILTSQASFSNSLDSLAHKTHGRTPSNDFIMSDTSLALIGELSSMSLTSGHTHSGGITSAAPANTTTVPISVSSTPVKVSVAHTEVKANSRVTDLPEPVEGKTTTDVTHTQQEVTKPAPAAPSAILDVANPHTFDIGQGRQRITKADFTNRSAGLTKPAQKSDDPFSSLDPMWSLTTK